MRFILTELDNTWPLFDITRHKFEDRPGIWAVISGLPDLTGRPSAWRHLFTEWKRMEQVCWHDGLVGWCCGCDPENLKMLRCLVALGAQLYAEEPTRLLFAKPLTHEPHWQKATYRLVVGAMRTLRETTHA